MLTTLGDKIRDSRKREECAVLKGIPVVVMTNDVAVVKINNVVTLACESDARRPREVYNHGEGPSGANCIGGDDGGVV